MLGQRSNGWPRLLDQYNHIFEVVPANTEALKRETYRLRYQVLAVEQGYFDPSQFPDGEESDALDERSSHWLIRHKRSGIYAGSVRVVLPDQDLPGCGQQILDYCQSPDAWDPDILPAEKCGEISRFNISKEFRRRVSDVAQQNEGGDFLDLCPDLFPIRPGPLQVMPYITLGLMQGVVRACSENGLTHVSAIMERSLIRLLRRVGVEFNPLGPTIELFGRRQPCVRDLSDLLDQVRRSHIDVWELLVHGSNYGWGVFPLPLETWMTRAESARV